MVIRVPSSLRLWHEQQRFNLFVPKLRLHGDSTVIVPEGQCCVTWTRQYSFRRDEATMVEPSFAGCMSVLKQLGS